MYFTREDILEIQHRLSKLSVKDSELPDARTPLCNNDIITMVQGGKNVKISVTDFIQQLHLISQEDFINVTYRFDESSLDIVQAVRLIPMKGRKPGQVITFENSEGKWEIWQYQSHTLLQWNNPEAWKVIGIPHIPPHHCGCETPHKPHRPDDKCYNPTAYSGKGRKHIDKNIVRVPDFASEQPVVKNLLTQRMLGKEHMIYIIEYDFDLNGGKIIIPDDCTLLFKGGSINNGVIRFNNTELKGIISIEDIGNIDTAKDSTYKTGQMLYHPRALKPMWWNGSEWTDSNGDSLIKEEE